MPYPRPSAPDPVAPPLARRVAAGFAALPEVRAVAVAGSLTGGGADEGSDLDLYVYAAAEIPVPTRAAIAGADAPRRELDMRFWEPGDGWVDGVTGTTVDVMYRTPAWIEDQLERVLVRHEASVGYSTCFWHNVRTSVPLFDRDGWFAELQRRADRPYPEPLRRAVVAKNHPLLRDSMFSFLHQIEGALRRRDAVSVQHRLTALLASYFDVLFALNRQPHPGEKRPVQRALDLCPQRPADFERRIDAVLASTPPPWDGDGFLRRVHELIDPLDELLAAEGLLLTNV